MAFVEGCSLEAAAPPVKDPHRVADSSTLRRWFQVLDSSQPPFSFLRRTVQAIDQWIQRGRFSAAAMCHCPGPLFSRSCTAAGLCESKRFSVTHHPYLGMRPVLSYARLEGSPHHAGGFGTAQT